MSLNKLAINEFILSRFRPPPSPLQRGLGGGRKRDQRFNNYFWANKFTEDK